jgi:hypothetical protein
MILGAKPSDPIGRFRTDRSGRVAYIPSRAITRKGRNVPSFLGVSGSINYDKAIATAERIFA